MRQGLNHKTASRLVNSEWGADIQLVSRGERIWRTFKYGKAKDGSGWRTR